MPVGIFLKFCTIPTSWFHVWMAQDRDFLEVFAGRGAVTAALRAVAWRISICIRDQKFLCRLTFSALDCKISNASLSNKCTLFFPRLICVELRLTWSIIPVPLISQTPLPLRASIGILEGFPQHHHENHEILYHVSGADGKT